jgi:transcriptional regulator with XRE-family HTH domain
MASSSPSPTLGQRRLARALRKLRTDAGLTIEQVAEKLELSPSTVSRMETAQAGVRRPDLRALLDLYQVTGLQRDELSRLVDESRKEPWWQEYRDVRSAAVADLEAQADSFAHFSALLVPGLLQTEAYSREVLSAIRRDATPDLRRLSLRMHRQAMLAAQKLPPYQVVLDEAVLRRVFGGRQIMHAQLGHLVDAAALPNVTLQVLPFTAGAHPGLDGDFTIYMYDSISDPDVVYLETAVGEAYVEDPGQTKLYRWIFDQLRELALDPEESIRVLKAVRDQLQPTRGDDGGSVTSNVAQEQL